MNAKEKAVENHLSDKVLNQDLLNSKMNLLKRMEFYKVPGVSLAVINEGKIEWVKGYGHVTDDSKSSSIDEHTLFQAGSISKSLTAFGALLLVQQEKIALDEDVNMYLKRWKVPENKWTKTEKVTLRRLLSHTAGTGVHGFPGYAEHSKIPQLVDVLEGKKPLVNTDPVRVISQPGTEFKYSGGGTTIVQLLIEDVTGERFDVWMQENVLKPLEMLESTFQQPLPLSYAKHAAYGHQQEAKVVEGKWHSYPEMAAADLWSTPQDLAQLILYIQSALKNEKAEPLHLQFVKEMVTRQKIKDQEANSSLGLFIQGHGKDLAFGHKGQDEGFIATLDGFAFHPQGVVIMMNNDEGWALMEEIMTSVKDVYK